MGDNLPAEIDASALVWRRPGEPGGGTPASGASAGSVSAGSASAGSASAGSALAGGALADNTPAGRVGPDQPAGDLEVAITPRAGGGNWVLLRVAGDPAGRILVYDEYEWECFLDGARKGEFGRPG